MAFEYALLPLVGAYQEVKAVVRVVRTGRVRPCKKPYCIVWLKFRGPRQGVVQLGSECGSLLQIVS